jgi:hypothetical protein
VLEDGLDVFACQLADRYAHACVDQKRLELLGGLGVEPDGV